MAYLLTWALQFILGVIDQMLDRVFKVDKEKRGRKIFKVVYDLFIDLRLFFYFETVCDLIVTVANEICNH
jgi:hypothetical protein